MIAVGGGSSWRLTTLRPVVDYIRHRPRAHARQLQHTSCRREHTTPSAGTLHSHHLLTAQDDAIHINTLATLNTLKDKERTHAGGCRPHFIDTRRVCCWVVVQLDAAQRRVPWSVYTCTRHVITRSWRLQHHTHTRIFTID